VGSGWDLALSSRVEIYYLGNKKSSVCASVKEEGCGVLVVNGFEGGTTSD